MVYSAAVWLDFAGSSSIIFLLTIAYGHIQRWFVSHKQGQMLLGIAFGGVAWLQMNMPLEPMTGLIIDLRNVPLVLCAAFLGFRASIFCFAIAATTRLGIGGVGMWSGLLGMTLAITAGMLWAHFTRSIAKRRLKHMVLLSLMASLHLAGAAVLPEPAQTWFITNASLPIALLNLITITTGATLLDAEQKKISREDRLAASAQYDPDHGALTKAAFERELLLRVNAGTMLPPAALMLIRLRYVDILLSMVPSVWRDKVLGLVRLRLSEAFLNSDLICALGSSALVIPLNAEQLSNKAGLQSNVMRLINVEPFQFSTTVSRMITVETQIYIWDAEKSLAEMLRTAKVGLMSKPVEDAAWLRKPDAEVASTRKKGRHSVWKVKHSTTEDLFGKATFLMNSRRAL